MVLKDDLDVFSAREKSLGVFVRDRFKDHLDLVNGLLSDDSFLGLVSDVASLMVDVFRSGNKVLICGNGGSAADAQHFATELTARFELERRALPAVSLSSDSSFLTAWSNDYSFDSVFSRQVEALGVKGDLLISFSTSGNSRNVLLAVEKARSRGLKTVSFLGRDGGSLKGLSDLDLIVPHENTARIQEVHELCYHVICGLVDKEFRE